MSHYQLDARHLLCPMPVIKTQTKMKELSLGDSLEIICTDPGALQDIPAWCRVNKHILLTTQQVGKEVIITVQKA